jgi:molecular chaperone DnaK
VPQIEVTFDIDANGIVHVAAKDRATGKEQSMTITGQSALNRDEIDRMMRDAEAHADEDRKRREEAEVRNNADTLVYQTEKLLKEQGEKATPEDRSAIEDALKSVKEALAGTDVDAIKKAHESLIQASQNFASRLYQQAAAQAQGASAGGAGGPSGDGSQAADGAADEEVADAEIVDEGKGA